MLRENQKLIDRIFIILSGIVMVGIYGVSYALFIHNYQRFLPLNEYLPAIAVLAVFVVLDLLVRNFSISSRFIKIHDVLRELFYAYAIGFGAYTASTYLFKLAHLSRLYFVGALCISYAGLFIFYMITIWIFREVRSLDFNYRNVLLIGNQFTMPRLIETIEGNRAYGLRIAGVMDVTDWQQKNFGYPHFGHISNIESVLNENPIDCVILTVYRQDPMSVEKAMLKCRERGVDVWLKPDFVTDMVRFHMDYLQDIPLLIFSQGPKAGLGIMGKRLLDIIFSFSLLAVLLIPMCLIAFFVAVSSKGPIFFVQKRVGINGRRFFMYKFRTMYHDIEQRKSEYQIRNEMKGPVFKMRHDPRVTPLGRFLRKYSLDELPQIWNVLIGEMSLVGPRPPLPTEVELYEGWQRRRLSMRPGLTCFWQVMGRNKIEDFETWAKMDLEYIDRWSLWLDIKILLMTIPAVLKGTGV